MKQRILVAVVGIPLLLAVGLGVPALMFPVMFKFGATKGVRYLMCFAILSLCICLAILKQTFDPMLLHNLDTWADAHLSLLFVSLTVVSLALFALSCAISTTIYQRKDL